MYVIIQSHSCFEMADWEGYTGMAGRGENIWVFTTQQDAQELADYMNSPACNYSTWRNAPELGWYVNAA